ILKFPVGVFICPSCASETRRYLNQGVSARLPVELFMQGKVMLGEGMDHMVFHSSAPIVRTIVAYLGRSSQVKANAITDAIL
ncbi:hypothetical protein ACC675_37720, partial [Rhizobium ruizarguesonis]